MTLDPMTSCHCVYDMNLGTVFHSEALQTCADVNGSLPEVDTLDRLQDFAAGYDRVWTGARRHGPNSWMWPSGQIFDDTNPMWDSQQPNTDGDCVIIYYGNLRYKYCETATYVRNVKCVILARSCAECQTGEVFSFSFMYGQ